MKKIEYIFTTHGGTKIHVLQAKASQNTKLGAARRILGTYHFSVDQVTNIDLKFDRKVCGDCVYSYNQNNGKSNGCYTHSGLMGMGLRSMLKRLHRIQDTFVPFDKVKFTEFLTATEKFDIELVRFGSCGDPVHLPIKTIRGITSIYKKHTGYTQVWHKPSKQMYAKYFMASTHSPFEVRLANDLGWRAFNVGMGDSTSVNCPASKEAKKKTTCASCVLCGGTKSNSKKNIHILKH